MLLRVLFFVGLAFATPELDDQICDRVVKVYEGAVAQMKDLGPQMEKKIKENCDKIAAANKAECHKKIVPQFSDFLNVGRENLFKFSQTACKEMELSSWASSRCSENILMGLRNMGSERCQRALFKRETVWKKIEKKFSESMDLVNSICGNGYGNDPYPNTGSSNGDHILGLFDQMNNKLKENLYVMTDLVCGSEEKALCKELTGFSDWILGKIVQ